MHIFKAFAERGRVLIMETIPCVSIPVPGNIVIRHTVKICGEFVFLQCVSFK